MAHAAAPGDAAAKGRPSRAPAVSDYKCEARSLRSVETVGQLVLTLFPDAPALSLTLTLTVTRSRTRAQTLTLTQALP